MPSYSRSCSAHSPLLEREASFLHASATNAVCVRPRRRAPPSPPPRPSNPPSPSPPSDSVCGNPGRPLCPSRLTQRLPSPPRLCPRRRTKDQSLGPPEPPACFHVLARAPLSREELRGYPGTVHPTPVPPPGAPAKLPPYLKGQRGFFFFGMPCPCFSSHSCVPGYTIFIDEQSEKTIFRHFFKALWNDENETARAHFSMLRAFINPTTSATAATAAAAAAGVHRHGLRIPQGTGAGAAGGAGGGGGRRMSTVRKTSGAGTGTPKVYPEEQTVEVGGRTYRRCAAALVFNIKGEVLVGERCDRPGSWNMPQGGVEVGCPKHRALRRQRGSSASLRLRPCVSPVHLSLCLCLCLCVERKGRGRGCGGGAGGGRGDVLMYDVLMPFTPLPLPLLLFSPQMGESMVEAASRELYEEVGMRMGTTQGLSVVGDLPTHDDFCYAAGGEAPWESHAHVPVCLSPLTLSISFPFRVCACARLTPIEPDTCAWCGTVSQAGWQRRGWPASGWSFVCSTSLLPTTRRPIATSAVRAIPYILYPIPYTLYPIPYTLYPIPCTLYPIPYTLHPIPYTLHPIPYTLYPTPYTLHPTPYTLYPIPYTLYPSP